MPEIGKPVNLQERAFQNVQMAPRQRGSVDPNDMANEQRKISDREKERFIILHEIHAVPRSIGQFVHRLQQAAHLFIENITHNILPPEYRVMIFNINTGKHLNLI